MWSSVVFTWASVGRSDVQDSLVVDGVKFNYVSDVNLSLIHI